MLSVNAKNKKNKQQNKVTSIHQSADIPVVINWGDGSEEVRIFLPVG